MSLRENLTRDASKTLRVREPIALGPEQNLGEAIALMRGEGSGCVVVTKDDKPIGILTERDILTKVLAKNLPRSTPIAEIMTSDPEVVRAGCSVATVIRRMHRGGFRRLPVVDGAGTLCGVISVRRIVEYLVDHFPSAVFNLPPDPGRTQLTREGA